MCKSATGRTGAGRELKRKRKCSQRFERWQKIAVQLAPAQRQKRQMTADIGVNLFTIF